VASHHLLFWFSPNPLHEVSGIGCLNSMPRLTRRIHSFSQKVCFCAAPAIPADRFPVVLKLQILSSSLSAPGSTFYPLNPLSDIGRTILEFDAIGLAVGEKFHRVLVDECHVPQIQHQVPLPGFLQVEQLSEILDIFCFNSAAEREHDSAIG
jgi:hypothetical protein